nr:MAG TPA: hypothetical protein [Caudoviricetes sp.]
MPSSLFCCTMMIVGGVDFVSTRLETQCFQRVDVSTVSTAI